MAEATARSAGDLYDLTAENSLAKGQIIQLSDGRAGYAYNSITAGDPGEIQTSGVARITKNSSIVLLAGDEVYWDHSANEATYKPVNDRDFLVGTAVDDQSTTSTQVDVLLNSRVTWNVDIDKTGFLSVPVGTQGYNTMGVFRKGGAYTMIHSSTSEAQKLDMLSIDGFSKDANAIVEFVYAVPSDGAGTVVDVSLGVANATHSTDADSITEHVFIHMDANSTTIKAQSKDGSTTVTATDTTKTYTEGSAVANRVYVTFDMRDPADVQIYINRVLVLASTVFNVNAAVGPFFLLAHTEKTSAADTYELSVHSMRARLMEQ